MCEGSSGTAAPGNHAGCRAPRALLYRVLYLLYRAVPAVICGIGGVGQAGFSSAWAIVSSAARWSSSSMCT